MGGRSSCRSVEGRVFDPIVWGRRDAPQAETTREFPTIRGTLFWAPYNRDPTNYLGYYIRVPYFRKLCQRMLQAAAQAGGLQDRDHVRNAARPTPNPPPSSGPCRASYALLNSCVETHGTRTLRPDCAGYWVLFSCTGDTDRHSRT